MKLNKYLIHDKKEVIKFIQCIFPKSFKFDFDKQKITTNLKDFRYKISYLRNL